MSVGRGEATIAILLRSDAIVCVVLAQRVQSRPITRIRSKSGGPHRKKQLRLPMPGTKSIKQEVRMSAAGNKLFRWGGLHGRKGRQANSALNPI